jgi:hypothetical protein
MFPAPAVLRGGHTLPDSHYAHRRFRPADPGRQLAIGQGPEKIQFPFGPGPAPWMGGGRNPSSLAVRRRRSTASGGKRFPFRPAPSFRLSSFRSRADPSFSRLTPRALRQRQTTE